MLTSFILCSTEVVGSDAPVIPDVSLELDETLDEDKEDTPPPVKRKKKSKEGSGSKKKKTKKVTE